MIKELKRRYPESNISAIDYDPGSSEVNQLNRLKLMLSNAPCGKHTDENSDGLIEVKNGKKTEFIKPIVKLAEGANAFVDPEPVAQEFVPPSV